MAIVLNDGDLLEGDATTAAKVTYLVSGSADGTTLAGLASGQLPNAKGTLYTAVGVDIISGITLFNTNTSAEAVNLYVQDGVASRQILGIDALGAGYHALFDGNKVYVLDNNGVELISTTAVLDNTEGGTDGETSKAPTSNVMYDHNARNATAAVQGHATAAQITKLDGIEALADVTDATNVNAAGAIMKTLLTEQGDIIYASGVGTAAALPHGTSSQYLKSGGDAANPSWDTPGPTIVRKTADETVNNSNVLQNDNELLLAVAANEVWFIDITLMITTTSVADFKIDFALPTGGGFEYKFTSTSPVAINYVSGTPLAFSYVANATAWLARLYGVYIGGANAGNVQLQWAQNTAEATDSKILANSCLIAHQLA